MKVSIIIPTCLRSDYELRRAVNSVICNGYFDIEIVIVNDNRLEKIREKDFRFYHSEACNLILVDNNSSKCGAASARNFGVMASSGDLITFLDDDDYMLPGRLEALINTFLNKESEGVKLSSTFRFNVYNDLQELLVPKSQIEGIIRLADIYINNDIDIGFLMRKSEFIKIGGFDTSFTNLEDWDFIIRVLKSGDAYKIKHLSYCVKDDFDNRRNSSKEFLGLRQLIDKHKEDFGDIWEVSMEAQYLRYLNVKSPFSYLKLCWNYKSGKPIVSFLKHLRFSLVKVFK